MTDETKPFDAYHTTTEHGERVVVVCPGGETDPLHVDEAEAWAREILAACNRARDVGDEATYDHECEHCGAMPYRKCRSDCAATPLTD